MSSTDETPHSDRSAVPETPPAAPRSDADREAPAEANYTERENSFEILPAEPSSDSTETKKIIEPDISDDDPDAAKTLGSPAVSFSVLNPPPLEKDIFIDEQNITEHSPDAGDESETRTSPPPVPSPLDITHNESPDQTSTKRLPISSPVLPNELFKVGEVVDHFEITRFVGQGGMGCVYEAKDTALDRRVAIKVLNYQRAQDQATVTRFLNEARFTARLNHEHIAQVYFSGEVRGLPYIAFEYVDGENLRDYVGKNGPIPLETAIFFMMQTADAIAHAANNGVTHRDIKPSNIIITPQLKAKLIDMGLARTLCPDDPDDELTLSGTALGTYDYMSPEQAFDARSADTRSDLYSLGCTFFFMLAGRPPFLDGKGLQKLLLHQGKKAPDVREFVPDLPESVSVIIQKLMEKEPDQRYQKPEELIADLKTLGEQIGVFTQEATAPVIPVPDSSAEEKKPQGLAYHLPWICSFLLVGLLGGLLWFAGEKESRQFADIADQDFQTRPSRFPASIIPDPNADSVKTLSPFPLSARRKPAGILAGGPNHSSEANASFEAHPRQFGGIGAAPVSSNDLLNTAEIGNLSSEGAKLLEMTSDSQSDLWTGSWSSVFKGDVKTEKNDVDAAAPFREGVDPVVDRKGKKDGCYETLDEAIASFSAWNQTLPSSQRREVTIRLAFDGDMIVQPLRLTDSSVRLVSAPGYSPRLVFRPDRLPDGGAASLWALTNSRLTLSDISVFFDSADQKMISEFWTLILFDSRSAVLLENTEMTIRNCDGEGRLFHPDTSFFRVAETQFRPKTKPGDSLPNNGEESKTESLPGSAVPVQGNLVIDGGVFQGEAALTVLSPLAPLRFEAKQTVMILDGPVLRGDEKNSLAVPEKRRVSLSMNEVFCWTRSPLLCISGPSAVSPVFPLNGGAGREISAEFNRCFLVLDEQPVAEVPFPLPEEEGEFKPNWKMTENLLANVTELFRFAGDSAAGLSLAGQNGETQNGEQDSALSFSNDNIRFHLDLPDRPLWNISREEAESGIFNQARKNLESEIGRGWLESLVSSLASR